MNKICIFVHQSTLIDGQPIMRKWKHFVPLFSHLLTLKSLIYIIIQNFNSVLYRNPFGINYSFLGKSLQVLHTRINLGRSSQVPSDWMARVCELSFSGLSTDGLWGLSLGFGWASQGQSETCPEATLALSWLSSSGYCRAERWNISPVWCHKPVQVFFKDISAFGCILSSILTSLPVPATEMHPHGMMLPPPCFIVGMVLGR